MSAYDKYGNMMPSESGAMSGVAPARPPAADAPSATVPTQFMEWLVRWTEAQSRAAGSAAATLDNTRRLLQDMMEQRDRANDKAYRAGVDLDSAKVQLAKVQAQLKAAMRYVPPGKLGKKVKGRSGGKKGGKR